MSLGLVVFSNINYYLFIYDVILTVFRIILSTWLYNNIIILGPRHIQPSTKTNVTASW